MLVNCARKAPHQAPAGAFPCRGYLSRPGAVSLRRRRPALAANSVSEAQVWTAYADFQSALSQHQLATALVATTKSGYDSALTGYGSGITNFVDLLAAERDYARALAVEIDARAAILDSAAALAFAAGTTAS